ncbi:hypothetical protein C8F01DRAFT_1370451 [Mycena amicta]|nr:hypothetical protein C8F01DRAFT_1370451 [Mycena amicta]
MASKDPRLPPELEREIFETSALLHPGMRYILVLVASRVHTWIEPTLYRTIAPDGSERSEHILALSRSKSPGFFQSAVRRVILRRETHKRPEILRLTPGATHVAIGDRFNVEPISETLLEMRQIQCLVARSGGLAGANLLDASLAVWACLTHLHFLDRWSIGEEKTRAFVFGLPSLTHLAIESSQSWHWIERLVQNAHRLRILVLLGWDEVSATFVAENAVKHIADARLVVCAPETWDESVREGYNFWDVAQEFLRQKTDGKVNESPFLAVRAAAPGL